MAEAIITRRVSKGVVEAEPLADIEVTDSPVTQVDITGLNITSDDEILLVGDFVRDGTSIVGSSLYIYVNDNLVDANYYAQLWNVFGTNLPAGRVNYPNFSYANKYEKSMVSAIIKLTSSGYFTYQSYTSSDYSSLVSMIENYGTSVFAMASINKISIKATVGNSIYIGSRFQLYKLGGA